MVDSLNMDRSTRSGRNLLVIVIIGVFLFMNTGISFAAGLPPGPDRYASSLEEYIQFSWWLTQWEDNSVVCNILTDHPGTPKEIEILNSCGDSIYKRWLTSSMCNEATSDPGDCSGLYLHLASKTPATRSIAIKLPPPVVWITLQGCHPFASTHRCNEPPSLILTGEEPLAGYSITGLEGSIDGDPFICDQVCLIDLTTTEESGVRIEFWANSSYGDTSELYTAQVRVNQGNAEDPYYYVDILSDQWRGQNQAPCMDIWKTFPPAGGLTGWLSTPSSFTELASDFSYEYLAGALIRQGLVDTSTCLDNGLLDNGYASSCGSEAARELVREWQNQFDEKIYSASLEVGVPSQLLKNIFGRESQFWPGISLGHSERGLGQMTRNGADTTLLWNTPFYEQYCAGILDDEVCKKGYPHLSDPDKIILQEAMVRSVDAYCDDCPLSIDLGTAENSVLIFANTLLANCSQAAKVIELNYLISGYPPVYEDLWKFTLVNYNAGPGCLGLAVNKTSTLGEPLTWENVSKNLTVACKNASDYVSDISSLIP